MTDKEIVARLRIVPDYPVKGIMFFDVTTLFKDAGCFEELVERICEAFKDKGITKVAGI